MSANLSKSDYKFVVGENVDAEHPYGDMDRLKTSFTGGSKGVIMPYRSGQDQYILSGEDACFLLEAANEREDLYWGYDVQHGADYRIEFSRKIKASPIDTLVSNVEYRYYDSEPVEVEGVDYDPFNEWAENHTLHDEDIEVPSIQYNHQLKKSSVLDRFDLLKKLNVIWTMTGFVADSTSHELDEVHQRNSDYPATFPSIDIGFVVMGGELDDGVWKHNGYKTYKEIEGNALTTYSKPRVSPDHIGVWSLVTLSVIVYKNGKKVESHSCYDLMKVGDLDLNSNRFVINPDRMYSRILSYASSFGYVPGFIDEENTVIRASISHGTLHAIAQTGNHTKWWA